MGGSKRAKNKFDQYGRRKNPEGCLVIIIAGIILLIGSVAIVRAFY